MKEFRYNDKWLFYTVYPILGLVFVHIGNDNTFQELLKIPSYYTDLLLALTVTYGIGFYLRWLINNSDPERSLKYRLKYQLVFGVLLPTCFALIIEMGYLTIIDVSVGDSSIFYLELPLIIIYLLLLNLVYLILHFRSKHAVLQKELDLQSMNNSKVNNIKQLIVNTGESKLQLPLDQVAYIVHYGKLTFITTTENQQFTIDKSMKELSEVLPPAQFYRLNRQVIASRTSIVKFMPTNTRKLKVTLHPPHDVDTYVAKANASTFTNWLGNR